MPPGLKSRRHEVQKIYSCNDAGDDLMLIGNVHWTFDDGQALEGNFSARAVVETAGQEGGPRLKLYQGWAVRLLLESVLLLHVGPRVLTFFVCVLGSFRVDGCFEGAVGCGDGDSCGGPMGEL